MPTLLLAAGLMVLGGLHPRTGSAEDRIVSLDTRPGVTQRFLYLEPETEATGSVILFPTEKGLPKFKRTGSGFKVKRAGWMGRVTGDFRDRGYAVAIVDSPSDRPSGMDTAFRQSPEHAEDLARVIAFLNAQTNTRPFLAATCRGTYSASSVASKVDNTRISGVLLAASRSTGEDGPIVWGADAEKVTVPVLFVHHVDDDCKGSPYSGVDELARFFSGAAGGARLVTVRGGWQDSGRAQKRGCGDNGSHKFFGAEDQALDVIIRWMRGEAVPSELVAGGA